jgi:hypothetical protein
MSGIDESLDVITTLTPVETRLAEDPSSPRAQISAEREKETPARRRDLTAFIGEYNVPHGHRDVRFWPKADIAALFPELAIAKDVVMARSCGDGAILWQGHSDGLQPSDVHRWCDKLSAVHGFSRSNPWATA